MALQELQLLSLFLAFSLAVLNPKRPGFLPLLVVDLILAALGFSFALYIYFDYWEFIFRVGEPTGWDLLLGVYLSCWGTDRLGSVFWYRQYCAHL
jgi:TRAP-type uncharacterized transport system fused permease subunit